MKIIRALSFSVAVLSLLNVSPSFAEDEQHYISIVPKGAGFARPAHPATKPAGAVKTARPAATTTKPAQTPAAGESAKPADAAADSNGNVSETTGAEAAPTKSFYSEALDNAVKQYKAAPSPGTYSAVLSALKSSLQNAGALRLNPAILAKDNPSLGDFKPRVIDAGGLRIWNFPRSVDRSRILMQWFEEHQTVVGTGRRKKVFVSKSMRLQELTLSQPLNIKDAGFVVNKDGRHLILAGDADDGSLSVRAYGFADNNWVESPAFLAQIPSFLTSNVCGRVTIRGGDLIFNIGKMIQMTDSSGAKSYLPEAESATYRFWVKSTDAGFVVAAAVPNEDAFTPVFQFMQAAAQSRTDVEKALLADSRLASLPKYLGLQGQPVYSNSKVVEMSVPAGRGWRYRLINMGKDDLIFDVGKFKNAWQIKAIFVAPPDAFLAETAKYFPPYSHFDQQPKEAPADAAAAVPGGGTGASTNLKRK